MTLSTSHAAGQPILAADINDIAAAVNALGAGGVETWTTYTPTVSGWTQGNGTVSGRYALNGNTLHCIIKLTWGSTSANGTDWGFRLPAAVSTAASDAAVTVVYTKASGAAYRATGLLESGTRNIVVWLVDGAFIAPNSVPSAFATGDKLHINVTAQLT